MTKPRDLETSKNRTCPLCRGTGKRLTTSFVKAGAQIERPCSICKGTGQLDEDKDEKIGLLERDLSACRAELEKARERIAELRKCKIAKVERLFFRRHGEHVPIVEIQFAPDDWQSRDDFAARLDALIVKESVAQVTDTVRPDSVSSSGVTTPVAADHASAEGMPDYPKVRMPMECMERFSTWVEIGDYDALRSHALDLARRLAESERDAGRYRACRAQSYANAGFTAEQEQAFYDYYDTVADAAPSARGAK